MIAPRTPDARSPGPRGPDAFSPTGGSRRRAVLAAADIRPSCQPISSRTASGRSGAASPAALAAYAAHPEHARPNDGRSRPARLIGRRPPPRERSPHERRHVQRNGVGPLRRQARHAQTPVAVRWHHGAAIPRSLRLKHPSTRPAQSAAHTATIRRSASLSVCGEPHSDPGRRCRLRPVMPRIGNRTPSSASQNSQREVAPRRGRRSRARAPERALAATTRPGDRARADLRTANGEGPSFRKKATRSAVLSQEGDESR